MDELMKKRLLEKMQADTVASQEAQNTPSMGDEIANKLKNDWSNYRDKQNTKGAEMDQMYPDLTDRLSHVHPEDAQMVQDMAGGVMGGIGKAPMLAAEGLSAGAQNMLKVREMLNNPKRPPGYGGRLDALGKGADTLAQESGAVLANGSPGNMTDAIAKAQIAAKMRFGK